MAEGDGYVPDWRDAAAYAPLLHADRSFLAWEWLRRNPGYRAAAERASKTPSTLLADAAEAESWGLHAFEAPGVAAPAARPVWRAEIDPYVLGVEAGPASSPDVFGLERFAAYSTLVSRPDGPEHLLISDGLRAIRLDVLAGSIAGGAVVLRYRLAGLASAERPVLTLRRLLAFSKTGWFCRSLHPLEARAKRWVLMLRASDALSAGADQREIAAVLLSPDAGEPRWRTHSPSLRSRAQRLVRSAREMESGGFSTLLSGTRVPLPRHLPPGQASHQFRR